MQVQQTEDGFASVFGRGENRRVNTRLLGDVQPGQWLLVFLEDAREVISEDRAHEVNSTLDLLAMALAGDSRSALIEAPFELPSAMDRKKLQGFAQ